MTDSTLSLGSSAAGSTYFDAQSMANTSESLRDAGLTSFAGIPPTLPEDAPFAAPEPADLMVSAAETTAAPEPLYYCRPGGGEHNYTPVSHRHESIDITSLRTSPHARRTVMTTIWPRNRLRSRSRLPLRHPTSPLCSQLSMILGRHPFKIWTSRHRLNPPATRRLASSPRPSSLVWGALPAAHAQARLTYTWWSPTRANRATG